jgi:hypothetical protein
MNHSKLPDANDERLEYAKGTELKDESSRYVLRESEYGEVPGILPQELLQVPLYIRDFYNIFFSCRKLY